MITQVNLFSFVFWRELKTPNLLLVRTKPSVFFLSDFDQNFYRILLLSVFSDGIYSDLISRLNIICVVFDQSSRIWQWYFWSHRKSDQKSRWIFLLPRTGLVHSYWYILISHLLLDVLVVVVSMIIEIWLGPLFGVTE